MTKTKKIFVILFFIFLSLALSEVILRKFWKPALLNSDYKRDDYKWVSENVNLNRYGYRDNDYSLIKDEGIYRIYSLGDSFTYGWYINNANDTYPKVLEKNLQEKYPNKRIEVINASRAGFSLEESTNRLENEAVLFSPDIVTLGINAYDLKFKGYSPKLINNKFVRNLRLYQLTFGNIARIKAAVLDKKETSKTYSDNSEQLKKAKKLIGNAKDTLDSFGSELVLIVFPPLNAADPNGDYLNDNYIDQIKKLGKELDIRVINLKEAFEGVEDKAKLVLNPTDPHPTILANKLTGEFVVKSINIDERINKYKTQTSISKSEIKLGEILEGSGRIVGLPEGWVYFDRKNELGTQKLFLPDSQDLNTSHLEDKLLTAKLNTHSGWKGAKIEYHVLGNSINFIIPKTLYGFKVLGVDKVTRYYRIDGAQRSEETSVEEIRKNDSDYYKIIFDVEANQFDLENNKIVEIVETESSENSLVSPVVEYLK